MNTTFGALNYSILAIYMVATVGIGVALTRRQKNADDYFLAGRRMPWLPVAMSMYASATSASTFMGLPGVGYSSGVAILAACFVSLLLVPVLAGVLYPTYRRLNCTTSYEYIGYRFGREGRYAVSALFILARLGWLGIVIYAPAKALSIATGIDLSFSILIIGVIATAYTTLGGLAAVIWTDVLQFLLLVGGAAWVFFSLTAAIPDGLVGIIAQSKSAEHFGAFTWSAGIKEISTLSVILYFSLQMLQEYGTDQLSVQRMLAVSSTRGAVKATIFNAFTDLFMISSLLIIGLGLFVFYQMHPEALGNADGDSILVHYIVTELPNGVSGAIIAAIFAAAMSSMDSGINALATVIEHDFLRTLRKRQKSRVDEVREARLLTLGLGAIAIGLAFYVAAKGGGIVETFAEFMSLFSAPVLALFLLAFSVKKARLTGWFFGAAIAIVATWLLQHKDAMHWTWYYPVSFAICFGIAVLYSAVTPQKAPPQAD